MNCDQRQKNKYFLTDSDINVWLRKHALCLREFQLREGRESQNNEPFWGKFLVQT